MQDKIKTQKLFYTLIKSLKDNQLQELLEFLQNSTAKDMVNLEQNISNLINQKAIVQNLLDMRKENTNIVNKHGQKISQNKKGDKPSKKSIIQNAIKLTEAPELKMKFDSEVQNYSNPASLEALQYISDDKCLQHHQSEFGCISQKILTDENVKKEKEKDITISIKDKSKRINKNNYNIIDYNIKRTILNDLQKQNSKESLIQNLLSQQDSRANFGRTLEKVNKNNEWRDCGNYFESFQTNPISHQLYKIFKCKICDKLFHRKKHVIDHYNGVHLNLRLFQCQFCGTKARSTRYLLIHQQRKICKNTRK